MTAIASEIKEKNWSFPAMKNEEFHFQKGQDALNQWLNLELSSDLENTIKENAGDYGQLQVMAESNQNVKNILDQLFTITSYCDSKAKNKDHYNQYDDNRTLARAAVRMNSWVKNLIDFKYNRAQVTATSILNALQYLLDPENGCTALSENHREQISAEILKKEYVKDQFVKNLKEYFSQFEITVKNSKNYTVVITNILYSLREYWLSNESVEANEVENSKSKSGKWVELLQVVNRINDKEALKKFFTAVKVTLSEFSLTNNSDLVYAATRGNLIHLTIGSRYVANIELKSNQVRLGFFVDGNALEDLQSKYPSLTLGKISESEERTRKWVEIPAHEVDFDDLREPMLSLVKESIKGQKKSQFRSQYQDKHNPYIIKAALNHELLDELLKGKMINENSDLMKKKALNQILFGPPGTGKTYNTINKSLELLNESFEGKSREEIKELYDQKIEEGQIVFTTFHQSMSYEDFVEGIKPVSVDGDISYEVEPGIFYKICRKAQRPASDNFDKTYEKFINAVKKERSLVLETLVHSKEFTIYVNSKDNLKFHANTEKAYEGVIKKDVIEKYLKEGIAVDWPSYTKSVARYMEEELGYSHNEDATNNFVLIIDEINRGNVSSIFGELITLIEEDKRDGGKEALEVELPYSKKSFKVPSNVFILGTMNTADRSVEALDTALRRRFTFTEMAPDSKLLSPQYMIWRLFWEYADAAWDDAEYKPIENSIFELLKPSADFIKKSKYTIWDQWQKEGQNKNQISSLNSIEFEGINLKTLLDKINERIEKLIDKDHKIGHSYFINVRSEQDLTIAFKDKVIPLLEEYFFGDFGKIGLVLGNSFVKKVDNGGFKFADFTDYDEAITSSLLDRDVFKIQEEKHWNFKSIYKSSKNDK